MFLPVWLIGVDAGRAVNVPPSLVASSYVQQRLWLFRVNDREPFLLGSLAQSGIRTEKVVKLLLAFDPECSRKLQGIERPQRNDRACADQKTNGLPLMHRDRLDEAELSPAQVGIEAPESLLKSRYLKLSCANLASQRWVDLHQADARDEQDIPGVICQRNNPGAANLRVVILHQGAGIDHVLSHPGSPYCSFRSLLISAAREPGITESACRTSSMAILSSASAAMYCPSSLSQNCASSP